MSRCGDENNFEYQICIPSGQKCPIVDIDYIEISNNSGNSSEMNQSFSY